MNYVSLQWYKVGSDFDSLIPFFQKIAIFLSNLSVIRLSLMCNVSKNSYEF